MALGKRKQKQTNADSTVSETGKTEKYNLIKLRANVYQVGDSHEY